MAPDEKIAALQTVKEFEEGKFIAMGTLRGVVKKTELPAFSNPRAGGIIAMGVEDGDRLMAAQITDGTGEIFIGTRDGRRHQVPGRRCQADGADRLRGQGDNPSRGGRGGGHGGGPARAARC